MAKFFISYQKTMQNEGLYNQDQNDVGGETFSGISRVFYPSWEGWFFVDKAKKSEEFPENLQDYQKLNNLVKDFYKNYYWDRFRGDTILNQDLADELFDTSVNLGVTRAVIFLQKSLNILNRNEKLFKDLVEDGIIGPITLSSIDKLQVYDIKILVKIINIFQGMHYIEYMRKSPIQEKFARGWFSRVTL